MNSQTDTETMYSSAIYSSTALHQSLFVHVRNNDVVMILLIV